MGKKTCDIEIGKRMYLECLRLFPSHTSTAKHFGISHFTIYKWNEGVSPSANNLARLHYAGGDVIWVLTGRKSDAK